MGEGGSGGGREGGREGGRKEGREELKEGDMMERRKKVRKESPSSGAPPNH